MDVEMIEAVHGMLNIYQSAVIDIWIAINGDSSDREKLTKIAEALNRLDRAATVLKQSTQNLSV